MSTATALTVIVPVNGVEGQLRQCLVSLTSQTLHDLEIIVVNDASKDQSARIIAELAAADPRIRVVTHDTPIGPGPCRNVGIALANGAYIGFVDGDDWVSSDFYESALSAAQSNGADVVVLDHVRAHPTGKNEPNRTRKQLLDAPTKGFTIDEHTELLENIPTVWNKIFRTEFIRQPEFTFDSGWYEDVPVTNLALCTARSIAVAQSGTYFYRQRPSSILHSRDDTGHIAVVERYEWTLDACQQRDVDPRVLRHIYAYSIWHLRHVEARGLTRFTPNGMQRLRQAIVEYTTRHAALFSPGLLAKRDLDWYRSLSMQQRRSVRDAVAPLRRIAAGPRRRVAKAKKSWSASKVRWKRTLMYGYALRRPVEDDLVVFASYWFKSPSGNPLAIYEELVRRAPHVRCVWVLDGQAKAHGIHPDNIVRQGSWEYYQALGRAKYFVNNVNFPGFVVKRPGTIEVQTTHGTPLKVMGTDERLAQMSNLNINALLKRTARWDYCLSANAYSSEIWQGAYPTGFKLLESGYPRNDILVRHSAEDARRVRRHLGLDDDVQVILYAPTYRQLKNSRASPNIDLDALAEAAGPNSVILHRAHYFVPESTQSGNRVIDVTDFLETNELLLAVDVLLTDYSSIMFDFANLRRPIVIYAPDCDEYMAERVTYFDIRDDNPGLVTTTEADLRDAVASRAWEHTDCVRQLEAFADRFAQFDDGHAAQRVVDTVFSDVFG